jgi:uncharacterized membrane protein YbaN (DUF454 family)
LKPVSRARKIFDWIAGLSLIALGIVGLFLPVLQGVLFILAGLAILSSHSPLALRILDALKARLRRVRNRVMKRE